MREEKKGVVLYIPRSTDAAGLGLKTVSGCGRRRVAVRRRRRHRPRPPPQPVRAADPVHNPDTLPCFPGHVKISLILSPWLRRRKRFACRDSGRGRAAGHSDFAFAVGGTVRQRCGQALPRGTTPKPAAVLIRNHYSFSPKSTSISREILRAEDSQPPARMQFGLENLNRFRLDC